MEQKHVFDGLRYGEKSQRSLLADQIVGVNSKLLQQALQNIEMPSKRYFLKLNIYVFLDILIHGGVGENVNAVI